MRSAESPAGQVFSSDEVPQAPNLDSHSPFSSGSLPCIEDICERSDGVCQDVVELQSKLDFLLDRPVHESVAALQDRRPSDYAPQDVLRDMCSLASALAVDRSQHYMSNLPTIVELLRRFIAVVQAGADVTGVAVEPAQSALLLADLYYLLANSLLQLHGNTQPSESFGWSTQGKQPDPAKVEEAAQLMQAACDLHRKAQDFWDMSDACACHGDAAGLSCPTPGTQQGNKRAIPSNMVPVSRIMTRAALIATARRNHVEGLELLKRVASMEPWIPEYELRPSSVQASHRQSVTFAHLCLARHYGDVGNTSNAMYHSRTAIAAKMHYERDVRGLHDWEVDALWEPEVNNMMHYTPPRRCDVPPGVSDEQFVDALCKEASESTTYAQASTKLSLALQHVAASQGKSSRLLLKPCLELLQRMIASKCSVSRGYAHASRLCWYAISLALYHGALADLERAESYMVCTLMGQEQWCRALTHAKRMLAAKLQLHGPLSTRVLASRPWLMGLYALKARKVLDALQPRLGSPSLARRRPTLPADISRHTNTLASHALHHCTRSVECLAAHLLLYFRAVAAAIARAAASHPASPCSTCDVNCFSPARGTSSASSQRTLLMCSFSSRESNDSRSNPSFCGTAIDDPPRPMDEDERSRYDPLPEDAVWTSEGALGEGLGPAPRSPTRRDCPPPDAAAARGFPKSKPLSEHEMQGPSKRSKRCVSFRDSSCCSVGENTCATTPVGSPPLACSPFALNVRPTCLSPVSSSPILRNGSAVSSSAAGSPRPPVMLQLPEGYLDPAQLRELSETPVGDLVAALRDAEALLVAELLDANKRAAGSPDACLPRPDWIDEINMSHWTQTLEALEKQALNLDTTPLREVLGILARTMQRMAPPARDAEPPETALEPFPATELLRIIASDPPLECYSPGSPSQQQRPPTPPEMDGHPCCGVMSDEGTCGMQPSTSAQTSTPATLSTCDASMVHRQEGDAGGGEVVGVFGCTPATFADNFHLHPPLNPFAGTVERPFEDPSELGPGPLLRDIPCGASIASPPLPPPRCPHPKGAFGAPSRSSSGISDGTDDDDGPTQFDDSVLDEIIDAPAASTNGTTLQERPQLNQEVEQASLSPRESAGADAPAAFVCGGDGAFALQEPWSDTRTRLAKLNIATASGSGSECRSIFDERQGSPAGCCFDDEPKAATCTPSDGGSGLANGFDDGSCSPGSAAPQGPNTSAALAAEPQQWVCSGSAFSTAPDIPPCHSSFGVVPPFMDYSACSAERNTVQEMQQVLDARATPPNQPKEGHVQPAAAAALPVTHSLCAPFNPSPQQLPCGCTQLAIVGDEKTSCLYCSVCGTPFSMPSGCEVISVANGENGDDAATQAGGETCRGPSESDSPSARAQLPPRQQALRCRSHSSHSESCIDAPDSSAKPPMLSSISWVDEIPTASAEPLSEPPGRPPWAPTAASARSSVDLAASCSLDMWRSPSRPGSTEGAFCPRQDVEMADADAASDTPPPDLQPTPAVQQGELPFARAPVRPMPRFDRPRRVAPPHTVVPPFYCAAPRGSLPSANAFEAPRRPLDLAAACGEAPGRCAPASATSYAKWARSCSMPANRIDAGPVGNCTAPPPQALSRSPHKAADTMCGLDEPHPAALGPPDHCQLTSCMKAHTLATSLDLMFDDFYP